MRGLIIKPEPLSRIFAGRKVLEIRGTRTNIRGKILLIQSGSGMIVGSCTLVDCLGPLTIRQYRKFAPKIGLRPSEVGYRLPYTRTFGWLISDAKRFKKPIEFRNPPGAVVWVRVPDSPCLSSFTGKSE
jgi:hypothetical protein